MANSNQKGKRGEREAAQALRALGIEARRGVQYSGSPDSPDVISSLPGVHIEVKRTERFRLYAALDQAIEDSAETDIPLVLHRANGKGWVAILRLNDLEPLSRSVESVLGSEVEISSEPSKPPEEAQEGYYG